LITGDINDLGGSEQSMNGANSTLNHNSSEPCPTCGKRVAAGSKHGSLTGYFFQSFYCRCGQRAGGAAGAGFSAPADFCPRCGLRKGHGGRRGSISEFLFQDIRCKCEFEAEPEFGGMSQRFQRLKNDADSEDQDNAKISVFKRNAAGPDSKGHAIGLKEDAVIGGSYRIIELLGRGGMGEVYLARHLALNKRCALKVIPPYQVSEETWQRFKQEARVISRLTHKNIVHVTDLGIHADCLPFYAMEFVDGQTLAELLAKRTYLSLDETLDIFLQVCDGLEHAHKQGVIHRDLKPANIIIATRGQDKPLVKILDFGLAKLSRMDQAKQSLTLAGDVFGSPFYMSPEQCAGESVDNRTDIYSLGCTMFECLTGSPPFTGNLSASIIFAQQEAPPPTLASIAGDGKFPDSMEIVVAKLLRKNPVERYQTMDQLRSDLLRVKRGEDVLPVYLSRAGRSAVDEIWPGDDGTAGSEEQGTRGGPRPLAPVLFTISLLVLVGCAGLAWYCCATGKIPALSFAGKTVQLPAGSKANTLEKRGRSDKATPASSADNNAPDNAGDKNVTTPESQAQNNSDKNQSAAGTASQADAGTASGTEGKAPPVRAWELATKGITGEQLHIVITYDKAQLSNEMATYSIGAPDFETMTAFNADHKTYAEMTVTDWEKERRANIAVKVEKIIDAGVETMHGFKCKHCYTTGHMVSKPEVNMVGEFWGAIDVPVSEKLLDEVCRATGTPGGSGLPMRYVVKLFLGRPDLLVDPRNTMQQTIRGNVQNAVMTNVLSIKETTVDPRTFEMPPKGFKKVKSHRDLYALDFVDNMDGAK
jgi:serine/threonine protein kinase